MSDKIDIFCENLRDKLNNAESSLNRVSENLKSAPQQAADAIRSRIDTAKAQHQANVQKVADTKAKLDEGLQAKKDEVESDIAVWKTNRELHKLERRADNAEDYAVAAIEFAAACIIEADLAALEAIEARLDADAAA